jgi:hypothetical protein
MVIMIIVGKENLDILLSYCEILAIGSKYIILNIRYLVINYLLTHGRSKID